MEESAENEATAPDDAAPEAVASPAGVAAAVRDSAASVRAGAASVSACAAAVAVRHAAIEEPD